MNKKCAPVMSYETARSYKKGKTLIYFLPSSCYGQIRDPGWEKIRILDKHPGSATLAPGYGSLMPLRITSQGSQPNQYGSTMIRSRNTEFLTTEIPANAEKLAEVGCEQGCKKGCELGCEL